MQDPIFIVGIPRSGSTLWLNIIAGSEDILRVGEMHFLSPWRKDFRYFLRQNAENLSDIQNVREMVELMFSGKAVPGLTGSFWINDIARVSTPDLKEKICEDIFRNEKTVKNFFNIIIDNMLSFSRLSRCCVKFPVYVNHVPDLIDWYPNCKVIHIIRDPRAVAISKTNDPGGTSVKLSKYPSLSFIIKKVMILYVIVQYIWTSRLHLKYMNYENYALFKYEDLLVNKEEVVRDLCSFANVEFDGKMLAPKEGQSSSLTGKSSSGFDKKAGVRWKEKLSWHDNLFISLMTKKSMKRFGFNPNVHPLYRD